MPVHRMVCTAEEAKGNAITLALAGRLRSGVRTPRPRSRITGRKRPMKKRHTPRGYQALVLGYKHPSGYDWPRMVPLISAPTRKEARRRLREHLVKSTTPFTIRLLWRLGCGKPRGRKRRARYADDWRSRLTKRVDRLIRKSVSGS